METTFYESEIFTPAELLAATGLRERQFQSWVNRGFMPQAERPGSGVHRQHSLADLMFLAYLRVLNDAHVPLAAAASYASAVFVESLPGPIVEIIRFAHSPNLAPRLFAVIGKRQLIVTHDQMVQAWAPVAEGEEWSLIVDLTHLVIKTFLTAEKILARRTATKK